MNRRLKMRERRSLRRYAQEFGGTMQVSFIAFRLFSMALPVLALFATTAWAASHSHHSHPGATHMLMAAATAPAVVMTEASKALRTARSKLIQEMHDLTSNSGAWNARNAQGKSEAQERWNTLNGQQEEMKRQIDAIESTEELRQQMGELQTPPNPQLGTDPLSRAEAAVSEGDKRVLQILDSKDYRSGFMQWVRTGVTSRAFADMAREVRTYTALNSGTGSQGEYTIPVGFQRELETKMKAYGGMRRNSRIVPTSTGNPLDWPTVDDTANQGRWLAENGGVSQTNPTFGQVVYNAYLASSDQVLVSVQLMQDSAFDLEALLAELLGIRLGRLTDLAYTKGSGSGQPTGLITSILADGSPNTVTAAGSSANDGGSSTGANSIGTDDFASLLGLVDPAYRSLPSTKLLAHWTILDYLKKVKDKYGRPIFVDNVSVGQPDRIFGEKYDWSGAMDAATAGLPAASTNTVLYGAFEKYIIRDVLGATMVRYNELYMPNHQVGFQVYLRTDGERLQQAAFGLLQQHS